MKTGFWLLKEDKKEKNFDFLKENEIKDKLELMGTPYQFLDGLCHSFAIGLKYLFGYDIEVIMGENGRIIHAYAVKDGHYIDVRGITDNWDEFLDEFDVLKTHDRDKLSIMTFEECFSKEFDCNDPDEYSSIIADDVFIMIDALPEYYKT